MIISCPNCETRYTLESSALGSKGRKVRCANCRHMWQAYPDRAPSGTQALSHSDNEFTNSSTLGRKNVDPRESVGSRSSTNTALHARNREADVHTNHRERVKEPRVERRERHHQGTSRAPAVEEPVLSNIAILSWIALALGVIVLSIMIIARKDIAEAYPPFKSGYEAIGLDFNQENPVTLTRFDTTQQSNGLLIEGELQNETNDTIFLQPVRITLKDARGEPLADIDISLDDDVLYGRESKTFSTRLRNVPEQASIIAAEVRQDRDR